MGPDAWAAVGRALAVAAASALFGGPGSVVRMMVKQIEHALAVRDLELAHALIRDLAYRHRAAFDQFMAKYGGDLPPDVLQELRAL